MRLDQAQPTSRNAPYMSPCLKQLGSTFVKVLDVSRCLSPEQAEMAVPSEMGPYARVAWTFLNNAGYINFGVAPAIAQEALETPQTKGSVIIIGGGMAGESASISLRSHIFHPARHCRRPFNNV